MDNLKKENIEGGAKKTSRLEAFSDGVFAIAITLLIGTYTNAASSK